MIRRILRTGLELLAFAVAGLAILVGLVVWRLSSGPVTVNALTPLLEQALSGEELEIDIGATLVAWEGFGRPLQLAASDVHVTAEGREIARLPELAIGLDVPALLHGELQPSRIALVGPALHLIRTADGSIQVALGTPDTGTGGGELVGRLLDGLVAPEGSPEALHEVSITDAVLTVDDRRRGVRWRADPLNAELVRDGGTVVGHAGLVATLGGESMPAEASLRYDIASEETGAELAVSGLVPADLARAFPVLAPVAGVDSVISGRIEARLDPAFELRTATFALLGGAGRLDLPEIYEQPVSIASVALSGWFDLEAGHLHVTRLAADFGGPRLAAEARVTLVEDTLDIAADAAVHDMPMAQLHRYWPPDVAGNARDWILEHITEGTARTARVVSHIRLPLGGDEPPDVDEVAARLVYDGLSVTYLDTLPPVTEVSGTGGFHGDRFALTVDHGRQLDLTVHEADILIAEFGVPGAEPIDIRIVLSGPFATVLQVLNRPRLRFPEKMGIDPADAGGSLSARLHFAFPLAADLQIEELRVGVSANLRNAHLGEVFGGLTASAVDAGLELDGQGMTVIGTGQLAQLPVEFTWREAFRDGTGDLTRIELSATLDEAARQVLGLPLDAYLRGPVPMTAVYRDVDRTNQTLTAALDLTPATVALAASGWVKPAGIPASAELTANLTRGELRRIPSFSMMAPDLAVAGSATFQPETMALIEVVIDRFVHGRTDVHGRIAATDAGYSVRLAGPGLDMRRWLDTESEGAETALPPLDIAVDLGELWLGDGRSLHDVSGTLARGAAGWTSADLSARTATGAGLQLLYEPAGPTSARITLRCDDLGAALAALDVLDTATGGQLTLIAMRSVDTGGLGAGTYSGQVVIDGLHVVDAPLLAELLAATSPRGLAAMLRTEGIRFDRIEANATLAGDRLEISNGRAAGGALGLSVSGTVNLERDTVDLSGTIVPVQGLNRAIGSIPLLGDVLTGGEDGGLFAFTYRVTGPLDAPDVRVNPLSVLAPGFLRELFFQGGGTVVTPGGSPPGMISQRPGSQRPGSQRPDRDR